MKPQSAKDIYWGSVLIVVGAIFLAKNLGYIDFYFSMRTYWPLILILIGVSVLINSWLHKRG